MLKNFLILLCFLVLSSTLIGSYRTNIQSISRREGLSNGAVNSIIKDAEGYIWFGTWNGLNRYDGSSIVSFLPGGKPHSIHNHVIRELYPSGSGPLWMLTNKGVSLYNNLNDRFYSFFDQEAEQINYETDIALSYSDEIGTWVSVFGRGIFQFDSISGQFIQMRFDDKSERISRNIKRIHLLDKEAFAISDSGNLYEIIENSLEFILQLPMNETLASSSAVLIQNKPYIFVTQRTGSAFIVDVNLRQVSQLHIPDDIITSFSLSKYETKIWAGTERGKIYSFNMESKAFELLNLFSDPINSSPIATRILSIFEASQDILWIGTDGNGVYNLKLSEFPIRSLSSTQLSYPIVRSILVTQKKKLLIGTKGGGIDIFDANGNFYKSITAKNGLSNNSVLSLFERQDGSIWVGTDGKGIDIISADFNQVRNFPRDFEAINIPDFASVYKIIEAGDKRLYLGTSGYGVIMVEFDKLHNSTPISFEQLQLDKSNEQQQKQIVYALANEKPGVIWVGTRGIGVYRYNTINKRTMAQYNSEVFPDLIRNDDILSLLTDESKNLWIGSSSGIFALRIMDHDSIKASKVVLSTDLSGATIHTLQTDKMNNLWITTNQGLSYIDISRGNVRSFTVNDGLINYEYSDGASFFDPYTSQLYVGGTMGVDIIQTDLIKFSSFFPKLAINDLLVRNQPVQIGENSLLTSRINHQNKLVLNFNQNALTFFVSPLAYWGKERHRISFRLKNFDNNWVNSPSGQSINFTNLSPGTYLLQLRVSDENGNWNEEYKEIEIVIKPPFWLTSWAIALYVFLLAGIQLLIIRSYRKRESRKKEAALIEYKQQKEKELQNYKIEFFTNVAHEFRTPLTLISSHVHALIEETKARSQNPRLLKVYNNSLKLQKLVLEIIQFRKLEKGKEPLNIKTVSPEKLAQEVVSDMELLAQKNEISCEVFCEGNEVWINTDADKYQRILTNLISNAIKYNRPGGFVKVKISCNETEFITEVEDNGIGIKPELKSKVFEPFGISSAQKKGSFPGYRSTGLGLAVTKGIVELLQGTITFESKPDAGTRFICRLPKVHEVNGSDPTDEASEDRKELAYLDEENAQEPIFISDSTAEKPTLLLVDDDNEILALLQDMLRPAYNLCMASNGKEALHLLENQKIDLVISDIMMPEMDGIELCFKIRENFDTSHLPLILLSAKAEIEDRIKGLHAGADSYIPKPFHPDHLKIRIDKLLSLRQNIRKKFGKQEAESTSLISKIPDPFFQKMLNYIDENIDDDSLSADKLSERLGISKSSLYNKTKSVLGTTPHGLLNQRRVKKAATLLDSTTLNVSEIIDQTGFKSRAHFYELFNQAFGCSPSEFRQKNKIEE
jgi:signal transduction histidine kinase/ligand-binding sensor domain-containing protein/CheY-like chemotaxis protein